MFTTLSSFLSNGPSWAYRRIWLHALVGACVITALASMVSYILGSSTNVFFSENGTHEMSQSLVLAIAAVAGVVGMLRRHDLNGYAAFATAVVSYVGFFREMPSCYGDVTNFCESPDVRSSFMVVGGLVFLLGSVIVALRHHQLILSALRPRFSWPLALAASGIVASQVSEEFGQVAIEEMLELYSYTLLMFGAGWLAFRAPSLAFARN